MLNTKSGKPIAIIQGGENDGKIICIDENKKDGFDDIFLDEQEKSKFKPILDLKNRSVNYIAGPSGSGKTTQAVNLIKDYLKIFPKSDFYLFSRTDYKNDPAFKGMKISQIKIDESLLNNPIDIEKELGEKSILLFDDCNTIQDQKLKVYIENLINDIMETGRKLDITLVLTNHLVIPNERKFARTVMNEVQYITLFPKSGSSQQMTYVLKTYFGLNKKQITKILNLDSRWVTIIKQYPMTVLSEKCIYIL
jgi:Cdc6-like AAA superfamily ATPase